MVFGEWMRRFSNSRGSVVMRYWKTRQSVTVPRARHAGRTLRIEQFENRRLMAVSVSLTALGRLEVRDVDTADNDIAIVGTANPGEVTVTGRNGTVVNGAANGSTTIGGVTEDVEVFISSNANHTVAVDHLFIADDIAITLGSNATNTVILGANGPVSAARFISVYFMGNGNNNARLLNYNVFAGQSLGVANIAGVGTENFVVTGASSGGTVSISTGAGNDSALLTGVTSSGLLSVLGRDTGQKSFAVLTSSGTIIQVETATTTGNSTLYLDTCYASQYITVLGNTGRFSELPGPTGPMSLSIFRCQTQQITVRTGQADDRINLYGNFVTGKPFSFTPEVGVSQAIYIDSRNGRDDVQMSYNVVLDQIYAGLGDLDDTMSLVGNSIRGVAYLDGAAGEYQDGPGGFNLLTLVNNSFGILSAQNFSNV
jgi:hypothetical protein